MEFPILYTATVILLMSVALATELFKPAIIVFSALLSLIIGNVISVDEAFAGFSNKGMLTVAFLFVVSASMQSSGLLDKLISKLLGGKNKGICFRYFRLMFPIAAFSAFLNNTPVVATMIPVIKNWTKRLNLPSSKYLIPLSYAAILGGTCTLIGTSTNLVVHGMLLDRGLNGFSFFELTKVSLPVSILGILFIALIGHKILPSKKEPIVKLGENTREFVVEVKVTKDYPMANKSIEKANLRHLQGLFLFQINRFDKIIAPVSHEDKILIGDRLFFTGLPETIYELQKTPGLNIVKDLEFDSQNMDSDKLSTYEAVISNNSPLLGQTVRDSNFRGRYDAIILAIHRSGSRINKKVGDIVFKQGDTLFILAKKGFDKRWYNSMDFSLVSSSLEVYSKPKWKGNIALVLLVSMVLLAAFGIVPIILAAASVAVLMIIIGIINPNNAFKSVDWGILLIISSSFGIGRALENSGLASIIASSIIKTLYFLGPLGIIGGIFFITSIYTELITNNAAAAIMFPIALATANIMDYDPRPLFITLAIAASASFATPIGYQTNLMVYSPGGYRFTDFLKIGVFMNIFVGLVVTLIVYLMFFYKA
ncbi:MAG: SLC13 family permease [Armatimonadetes bacterium]|nr:SLC13 family permease [Armatimonadota bacterium]